VLDLVRQLSIAWKSMTAYSAGHPAVETSLAAAHRRLHDVIAAGGDLTFGVSRDALLVLDEKLQSPHARDLAGALYVRDVALLTFTSGVEASELRTLFANLGGATRHDKRALGDVLGALGVTHIRVEDVDFSQVRAVEGLDSSPARSADLWESILRALLEGQAISAEGRSLVDSAGGLDTGLLSSLLAGAEGEGGGSGAGSGAGEGTGTPSAARPEGRGAGGSGGTVRTRRLTMVADAVRTHLKRAASAERIMAVNQVAELVRALPLDMREGVMSAALSAVSDSDQKQLLDVLAGAVAPDTMLQALRRLAAEGPLGEHALRLMRALGSIGGTAGPGSVEHPTPEVTEELRRLYALDDADRFNPEDHAELLDRVQVDVPLSPEGVLATLGLAELGPLAADLAEDRMLVRLGWTCLEMLGQMGTREGHEGALGRLEAVFQELVAGGHLDDATALAEEMRALAVDETTSAVLRSRLEEAMSRMGAPHVLGGLLEALHRQGAQAALLARRLIDALGGAAGRSFLLALVEEEDKSRRRRLLELLVSIGPPIVPHVVGLLGDGRWYVVRNMVLLLHRIGDRASVDQIRRTASHLDLRVRLEAIKCLLSFDPRLAADLLEKAIKDPDPKLAETAIGLAGNYGIAEAVAPMLDIVDAYDLFGRRRSMRLKALKALGELARPEALPRLDRYFRNWRVPLVALEERRAAFRSLHGYPPGERAAIVARGLHSGDEEIRRICASMPPAAAPAAEASA
jgi:hypothetical protein